MDAQVISIATAVVSAAVAALGLLLTWYRREENKENPKNRWYFLASGIGIVILAVLGVTFTFVLGSNDATSEATPQTPVPLTEVEYRAQASAACTDAQEKSRRLDELKALRTLLGTMNKVEQDEVNQIEKLQPPEKLKGAHGEMISIWKRRINLMESLYHRLPQLNEAEVGAEIVEMDRLAEQHEKLAKSLGLPECVIG